MECRGMPTSGAVGRFGPLWFLQLPRVPLTKTEVKFLLKCRMEADEMQTIERLVTLGSRSAEIIARLELSRELARELSLGG